MARVNSARHPQQPPAGAPASPPARRVSRRSWRDPRLVVGLVIVSTSVLLGATLFARSDDTVRVWSARADLPAGTVLEADDLEPAELRFATESLAGHYLAADEVPAGRVLLREVPSGEMVPRSAVGTGEPADVAELPIGLPPEAVPVGLRSGQVVDVWVAPAAETGDERRAVRVLREVRVLAAPQSGSGLGPAGVRQVVVGVPAGDDAAVGRALAELAEGTAVLVRRG